MRGRRPRTLAVLVALAACTSRAAPQHDLGRADQSNDAGEPDGRRRDPPDVAAPTRVDAAVPVRPMDGGSASDDCASLCPVRGLGCALDPEACEQACRATSWLDECLADCSGDCTCHEMCVEGKTLTCGGYCAYLHDQECASLDYDACHNRCLTDGELFERCTSSCRVRDCPCLQACAVP